MGAKSKATRFWWCFFCRFSWWHNISVWRKTTKTQGHVVMAMVVAFHESWWNRIIGKLGFLEDWDIAILIIRLVKWWCFKLYPTLPKTNSDFAPENRPRLPQKERFVFQPVFQVRAVSFREDMFYSRYGDALLAGASFLSPVEFHPKLRL